MQRLWRVRRVQVIAAALVVAGAAVGVATQLGSGSGHTNALTPLPGASSTAEPSPRASTPGVPRQTQRPEPSATPSTASVPTGYYGADLSWVSADDGFALAMAACGSGTCARLLRTTDAGHDWSDVGATGLPRRCTTACPLRVRFANTRVGYVYGAGLVMTVNGGRTWARQPGPDTHGLEIAGGTAVRVVERSACPGCTFSVQRSEVGTSSWHTVYRSDEGVSAADLVRQGHEVAVDLRRNPAGGAGNAQSSLLISTDGGSSWTRYGDPCGGTRDQERDASQLTWSQDGKLVVLCQRRLVTTDGGNSTVLISADAGRTFSRPTGFGASTDARLIAAGTGVLLAETHHGNDTRVVLQRSTDGGRTWSPVARASLPDGSAVGYLAFSSSRIVTWVPPGADEVRRSTDAGKTWRTYRLQ